MGSTAEGYAVDTAADGDGALRRLLVEPRPDLAIVDLMMPGTDGLEVCRRLRASGARLPVLMLRGRVAAITACVVAAAVVGTGAVTWFATRHHLLAQLDQTLLDRNLPTLTTIHEGATEPTVAEKSLLCDPPEHQLQEFLEGIQLLRPTARAVSPTVWTGWSPRRRTGPSRR